MKTVILDGKTLGDDINLDIFGDDTEIYGITKPELVADRIKNAEVVIINKIKLFEENLKDAKNLKLICVAATGYDNVDLEYCKEHGIGLCNVPGYSTASVALHAFTLLLANAFYF